MPKKGKGKRPTAEETRQAAKREATNARRRKARAAAAAERARLAALAEAKRCALNERRRAARAVAVAERARLAALVEAKRLLKNEKRRKQHKKLAEERRKAQAVEKAAAAIPVIKLPKKNKLYGKLALFPPEFAVVQPDSRDAKEEVKYKLTELEKWFHAPIFLEECRAKREPSTDVLPPFRYRDLIVDGELIITDIPYPRDKQGKLDLLSCILTFVENHIEPMDLAFCQIVFKVDVPKIDGEDVKSSDARYGGVSYYGTFWQPLSFRVRQPPPAIGYTYPMATLIQSAKRVIENIAHARRPFPHTILVRVNWNPQGVRPDRIPEE